MLEFEVVQHGWGVCAKAKGRDLFVTGAKAAKGYMGTSYLDDVVLFEVVRDGRCLAQRVVHEKDAPGTMIELMKRASQ